MRMALICVLITGLMPYFWTTLTKVLGPSYDNRDARAWQNALTGRAHRTHAAHLNSFEAFPLFAVAVLVAHIGGGDPGRVDALALAFVGLRLLYGVAYLMDRAMLRSALWFAAFGCAIAIFLSGS